jgi:hypothetical protein
MLGYSLPKIVRINGFRITGVLITGVRITGVRITEGPLSIAHGDKSGMRTEHLIFT